MTPAILLAFWSVSMLLVLTPGADWAYTITAGVHHRSPIPAISGLLVGYLVLSIGVAAGAASLIAGAPMALTALTLVGAGYLAWLGVVTLRSTTVLGPQTRPMPTPWTSRAARGVAVSGLNPKALLLFVALLPQFVRTDAAWPVAVQLFVLGMIHLTNCGLVYVVVATTSRRLLRTRPAATRVVTRVSGVAMLGIAGALLVEQALAF